MNSALQWGSVVVPQLDKRLECRDSLRSGLRLNSVAELHIAVVDI